jgi:hypothetical protein
VLASGALRAWGREPRGAVERGHGQWPSCRPAEEKIEEGGLGAGRKEKGEAPTGGVGRPVRGKRGRGLRGNWARARPTRGKEERGCAGPRERNERGKEARGRKESGPAWPKREEREGEQAGPRSLGCLSFLFPLFFFYTQTIPTIIFEFK